MSTTLKGITTGNYQEVDSNNNVQTKSPGYNAAGTLVGGGNKNAVAMLTENDAGTVTSNRYIGQPEANVDSQLRIANECLLDDEQFNYAAQNTGKHQYFTTTMTLGWTTAGLQTNATGITTTTTGASFRSYAMFPLMGSGQVTYCQTLVYFSANPSANQVIDFGLFQQPTSNPFAPTDGIYFRVNSANVQAVINNNGTEVAQSLDGTTGTGLFNYVANTVYKFTIEINESQVVFWINDIAYYVCHKCARIFSVISSFTI